MPIQERGNQKIHKMKVNTIIIIRMMRRKLKKNKKKMKKRKKRMLLRKIQPNKTKSYHKIPNSRSKVNKYLLTKLEIRLKTIMKIPLKIKRSHNQ